MMVIEVNVLILSVVMFIILYCAIHFTSRNSYRSGFFHGAESIYQTLIANKLVDAKAVDSFMERKITAVNHQQSKDHD